MSTQDSIQQFTQSQILGCHTTIRQRPQNSAIVEGALCKSSITPPVHAQRLIEVTPNHKRRAIQGRRIERSPLSELNGDARLNSEVIAPLNASSDIVANTECKGVPQSDFLPDMALSLCTPLTPPSTTRRDAHSPSPGLEAELDELIREGLQAEADRQVQSELPDMALSLCTPLSMPMSMCTPPSQVDMALSLCTPLTPPEAEKDLFRQPTELLRAAALQVATSEAQSKFGWTRLKSFQKGAIEAWAAGRNCFLLSGTGSGKTGCFVLPALVARRWHERQGHAARGPSPMAIVVSPIVSLMRDQVGRLQKHGIDAAVLSPQCNDPHAWKRALSGEVVLLYTCPEKLFKLVETGELQRLPKVSLLAIDESHCVSEWGFDFRPEYGQLNRIIEAVGKTGYGGRTPPVLCVTATCTQDVRDDVIRSLQLKVDETDMVTATMNRPNIHFVVEELADRNRMQRRLLEMFDVASIDQSTAQQRRSVAIDGTTPNSQSPTIVYTQRKTHCDQLARVLDSGGVRAAAYHSGLSPETRQTVQEAFNLGQLQVVIATVAFGMGIDKPDVRRVIHYGMPKCIESYSQESGRAGRDGGYACCTILFMSSDRTNGEKALLGESPVPTPQLLRGLHRLQKVYNYCRNNRRCRRTQLLEHLGENPCDSSYLVSSQPRPCAGTLGFCANIDEGGPVCGRCDTCCSASPPALLDAQSELLVLLQSAQSLVTCARNQLVDTAYKASAVSAMNRQAWTRIVDAAFNVGFIDVDVVLHRSYAVHILTTKGRERLKKGHINEPFLVDVGKSLTTRPSLNLPVWRMPAEASEPENLEVKELLNRNHNLAVVEPKLPNVFEQQARDEAPHSEHQLRDEATSSESCPKACPMMSHAWFSSSVKWHRSGSSGTVPEGSRIDFPAQQINLEISADGQGSSSSGAPGEQPPSRRLRRSGSSGDQVEFPMCRTASSSSSSLRAPASFKQPPSQKAVMVRVEGAGGVGASTNGNYVQIGTFNGKPKFKQVYGNATVFYALGWRINSVDDIGGWFYQAPSPLCTENLPPAGAWTTEGYDAWDAEPPPSVFCLQQAIVVMVEGAGGVGAPVNGTYRQVGTHNDRPKFKKVDGNAVIFFDKNWYINSEDDCGGWLYQAAATARETPLPVGTWTTDGYHASDAEPPPSVSWSQEDDSNDASARISDGFKDSTDEQMITILDSDDEVHIIETRESLSSSKNGVDSRASIPTCAGSHIAEDGGLDNASTIERRRQADSTLEKWITGVPPVLRDSLRKQERSHGGNLQEDGPPQSCKRRRRTRSYTAAERRAATPFVAKLMEAADYNSDVKGGNSGFKQLMQQARILSPPEWRENVDDVLAVFQSNVIHVHGHKLDELIDSLRTGNQQQASSG